jgi:hypothetical protein
MIFSKKKPIPPKSIVKLVRFDAKTPAWADDINKIYRVGYYSKQDGLDVIWLVNDSGEYEQTTNQASLANYFTVLEVADEDDYFGDSREPLGPTRNKTGQV